MNRPFIKGLALSEVFYREAVAPILARRFPKLRYSAALIGAGSEVLGFDTPQSMDHDWGPRLTLFLGEADHAAHRDEIDQTLRRELPAEIHGYPTSFGTHADGTGVMVADEAVAKAISDGGAIDHRVLIVTVRGYFVRELGFDPVGLPSGSPEGGPVGEISAGDWVSVPAYRLLMLTSGRVFHDGLEQLHALRARLSYYPHDVWLYLLAAQWRRIAQEEAFVGRCAQVGDELGSRLVAARLVRDLIHLCFLMERRYAPYIKWLGSAFARLDCGPGLAPILTRVLGATTWEDRETHLSRAYETVAEMHNALGITEPLAPTVSPFHGRPFLVPHADRFADALRVAIQDDGVRALPEHLGNVDQFVDSTDALACPDRLRGLYS
ncbi:MAG: DUF4037 domain-containing protein [Anaerolineae bacterium]|nr:DUF4037 domain-containing protein [Anaerolineae bacterium]